MHPFHSLFTDEPDTEYVPDIMGRLGQGGFDVKPDPEPIGTPSPRFNEFIKAEQSGIGLRDLFGANPLAIKGPVGPFEPNRRADVGKVETFLSRSGNFDLSPTDGPTGYYGLRLEDAINAFHKKNNLKTDGLLKPFGETIRTLAGKLKDQIKPPTSLVPHPKPAAPLTLPGQGVGQKNVPLKHTGTGAAAAPPAKDPLEEFKKADRESIKALAESQKPKPTHRQAERTGEQRLTRSLEEKYRAFLQRAKLANTISKGLREIDIETGVKIDRVIAAYQRYLDGKGGVVNYDPKWMLSHPKLREAAKRNEGNFEKWMTGKGKENPEQERIVRALLELKDGQTKKDSTPFDGAYLFDKAKDKSSDHRLLLGTGFIKANGKFTFTRNGNSIEVTGMVEQNISDPFDFHSGNKFLFRKFGFEETVDSDEMIWLAKNGKAKPFEVRSVWQRKITWRLKIVRDPSTGVKRIVGVGQPKWSDAK